MSERGSPPASMAIGLTGNPEVLILGKGYLLGKNRTMPSTPDFSPNTDELVANNSQFVANFRDAGLALHGQPYGHLPDAWPSPR
jgi:hypothetical protein